MRKSKREIELADGPLMKLSFMRSTKVLDEDRASISEPDSHSEKTASLSEILNCRISLSTYRIWISKNRFALKQRASKNSHKVWSKADVSIGEDTSNKIVKQLFESLEANED